MEYQGLTLLEHDGRYYFEDRELAATHDPKQADEPKRDAFLQKYGLRLSTVSNASINYLLTGRARTKSALYGGRTTRYLSDDKIEHPEALGWFDHSKMLYHPATKAYVITTQPYNLTLEKYQALEQLCAQLGLVCRVSITEAWHYPGRTPLVVLARAEVMAAIFGTQK